MGKKESKPISQIFRFFKKNKKRLLFISFAIELLLKLNAWLIKAVWLRLIMPFGDKSILTEWLPRWEGLNKPCWANGNDIFKNAAVLAHGILALYEKWQLSPGETTTCLLFPLTLCVKQSCWLNGALNSGFPLNAWAWFTDGLATLKPIRSAVAVQLWC